MVPLPYILVKFYHHHQDIYMSAYLSFLLTVFIYSLKVLYIFRMYICYIYHWISLSNSSQDPQTHISLTFMSSFIIAVLSLSPFSVDHTCIGMGPSSGTRESYQQPHPQRKVTCLVQYPGTSSNCSARDEDPLTALILWSLCAGNYRW